MCMYYSFFKTKDTPYIEAIFLSIDIGTSEGKYETK